jgi:hypothetical protein
MSSDEIWSVEEGFWTGGIDHYRAAMDPACVMVFQAPIGILTGERILETIEGAPRWESVSMSGRRESRPSPEAIVLAYEARGRREGSPAYEAYCASVYVRTDAGWRLVLHQQTPR